MQCFIETDTKEIQTKAHQINYSKMGIFLIILLVILFLLFLLYLNNEKTRVYFESKGVPYFGNGTLHFIKQSSSGITFNVDFLMRYNGMKAAGQKIVGSGNFGVVEVLISDPELIKSVTVKDFDHFVDRGFFVVPKHDYLLEKMLIALKGEQWKALRSKLSPTFTTGKIKRLFQLFNASGKKLVAFVEKEVGQNAEINLEESYSKFAMDVIASAVIGMDAKAFPQKEPSLFEQMGKKLQLSFSGKTLATLLLGQVSQKLVDFLGMTLFDSEMQTFFTGAIKSTIKDRQQSGEKRNDFIQLMLDAREGKLKLDENELDNFEKEAQIKDVKGSSVLDEDLGIAANSVLFILAGFDTTQSLLLFVAYALALNQEVQSRLREELDKLLDESEGEFTYDGLNNLGYLDMVINETLRMFPPAGITNRMCTKPYKIPGTQFSMKTGEILTIPIWGLHLDERFFTNPMQFDPERFSPENKSKINPYAYLPFGQGPRNCIGMRFALTEVKVAIAHLVHNFRIEPSKKTMIPMKYSNANSLKPKGGMFLALNKIEH